MKTLLCSILLLVGAPLPGAPMAAHWNVDSAAIEKHYALVAQRPNLHTAHVFPDGAKGEHWGIPMAYGSKRSIPTPFEKTQIEYCAADAIVVGMLLESSPVLLSTKASIYSLLRFSVSEVIKSDGILSIGRTAIAYRIGGELEDAGEKLRVDFDNRPPYRVGATYILELMRDKAARKQQYYFRSEDWTVELKDSAILPNYSEWAGFSPHTAYSDVVSRFQDVAKIDCDRR